MSLFSKKLTECDLIVSSIDSKMFDLRAQGCKDGLDIADEIAKELNKIPETRSSNDPEIKNIRRQLNSDIADVRVRFEQIKLSKDNNKAFGALRANFAKEKSVALKVKKFQKLCEKRFLKESATDDEIKDMVVSVEIINYIPED
jgi:hypothetical protein